MKRNSTSDDIHIRSCLSMRLRVTLLAGFTPKSIVDVVTTTTPRDINNVEANHHVNRYSRDASLVYIRKSRLLPPFPARGNK